MKKIILMICTISILFSLSACTEKAKEQVKLDEPVAATGKKESQFYIKATPLPDPKNYNNNKL